MKYSASPAILQTQDLAQLAWDAIEPIWDDLPFQRFSSLTKFMKDLTDGQRGLIALDWCQKEIRNGGLPQLFTNSTGNLVPWALEGFQQIGATKYFSILSEAASMLGTPYPESGAARRTALGSLGSQQKNRLKTLELEFFSLLSSESDDLEGFRGGFVRDHPEQFVRSG